MADANTSFLVSIGSIFAALAAVGSVITFWMRLSDRITRAEGKSETAMQEAAEAKNDISNLEQIVRDMHRGQNEMIERFRRENGEGLSAIRQHVTDLAMFVRDNFVRSPEFSSTMKELKDAQLRIERKIDEIHSGK